MKFSSGFTAFVAASVATANLAQAAPLGARSEVSQSNSQGTSQQASGKIVVQGADSTQKNNQAVKISTDGSLHLPAPVPVPAPKHAKESKNGDLVSVNAVNGNDVNASKRGLINVDAANNNKVDLDLLSSLLAQAQKDGLVTVKAADGNDVDAKVASDKSKRGALSLLTVDAADDNTVNAKVADDKHKRGLPLLSAAGQQSASADGFGGSSAQSQVNKPVVSGAGNSVQAGGNQSATNDGTGGQITQDLLQQLSARQLFESAQGKQGASANGYGGTSFQGQSNAPVLSGSGNSLTAGGAQGAENNGMGGQITQDLLQKLTARQLFSQGKQGASANGYGGDSSQGQTNAPVLSGSGNSLTAGGAQQAENNGMGGSIQQTLSQLQSLGGGFGKRQLFSQGKQGASADGFGGSSFENQNNAPVLSGAGNSLTAGGAQSSQDNGQGGSIEQSLSQLQSLGGGLGKRQLFASGKQSASADGTGGSSLQNQINKPVLSGAGNSLTAGGSQFGENNGQGGDIQQSIAQKLGLSKRQLFASGSQKGSADGFGGESFQGQTNAPVVSGAGNSVTTGGSQFGQNDGTGGTVDQSIFQKLGFGKRQYSAFGSQGASANGYGGSSWQSQTNRPVVSGTGNSVTTGGAQGATNNGQGGSITQGLQQLFGRQYQDLGQGIGQGIDQTGSASAKGGSATLIGQNGPSFVDGSATAGTVNQGAKGQQYGAQSATQDLTEQTLNKFGSGLWGKRQFQGLDQGINQGIKQNGQANAEGGSATLIGGNGPAYVNGAATGGYVNQNGQASQQGQQSGTQSIDKMLQNVWGRDLQAQGQYAAQGTHQSASADAVSGPVRITGNYNAGYAPISIDTSAHAGKVDQTSYSNQQDKQGAAQDSEKIAANTVYPRQVQTQIQGNSQDTSSNADASASAGPYVASGYFFHHYPESFDASVKGGNVNQNTQASQANKQDATQSSNKKTTNNVGNNVWRRQVAYGSQYTNADAHGGDSYSEETNDKVVNGNGLSSVQGGAQTSDGSATGGSVSQLLKLVQQ